MPGAAKTAARNQHAIKRTDAGIEQRRKEREQKNMNNQNNISKINNFFYIINIFGEYICIDMCFFFFYRLSLY